MSCVLKTSISFIFTFITHSRSFQLLQHTEFFSPSSLWVHFPCAQNTLPQLSAWLLLHPSRLHFEKYVLREFFPACLISGKFSFLTFFSYLSEYLSPFITQNSLNLLHVINELIFVKCLEQCKAHKYYVSDDLKKKKKTPTILTTLLVLLMSPFYRGQTGTEKLSNLSKAAQLISNRV